MLGFEWIVLCSRRLRPEDISCQIKAGYKTQKHGFESHSSCRRINRYRCREAARIETGPSDISWSPCSTQIRVFSMRRIKLSILCICRIEGDRTETCSKTTIRTRICEIGKSFAEVYIRSELFGPLVQRIQDTILTDHKEPGCRARRVYRLRYPVTKMRIAILLPIDCLIRSAHVRPRTPLPASYVEDILKDCDETSCGTNSVVECNLANCAVD